MDFRRGHRVTGKFRRSQIVTPVAAECIARMGVTTPCLGIRSFRLDTIETDNVRVAVSLREMLKVWLKNADQPTWERVAATLESRSVNNSRLARDIRVRYCGAADDALRPQGQASRVYHVRHVSPLI